MESVTVTGLVVTFRRPTRTMRVLPAATPPAGTVTVSDVAPQVAVPTVLTKAGVAAVVVMDAWLLSGLVQLAPLPS